MYPNLNDQQTFRLNIINEIKDNFIAEICETKLMCKLLSKYIAFLTTLMSLIETGKQHEVKTNNMK